MVASHTTKVPFLDLRVQYRAIRRDFNEALEEILEHTAFVLSEQVSRFEEAFARYCEVGHCVGVNSGTDALALAFKVLGIGPGDEVILPTNTFIATAEAISMVGATPVLVDIIEETKSIDPQEVEKAITPATRVITPVHLFGNPAPLDEILELADIHKLAVVEDAAQAHGARYKEKRVGGFGHLAAFSFYPGKNLGAFGDGGAIVTDDVELYETLSALRNHGSREKYHHNMIGINSRLDAIQAVVLSLKLAYLDAWNARRRNNANTYRSLLENVTWLHIPSVTKDSESVYHLFTVEIVDPAIDRNALLEHLRDNGIGCGIHYPVPLHLTGAYAPLGYPEGSFPVAARTMANHLSLPMYAELTEDMIEKVVAALTSYPKIL